MLPDTDPLTRARRDRATLFERITWWEAHRYSALVPVAMVSFGAGYGLGALAHVLVQTSLQAGYFVGVGMLFAGGRAVDRMFSPTRLAVLDARIQRLERQRP